MKNGYAQLSKNKSCTTKIIKRNYYYIHKWFKWVEIKVNLAFTAMVAPPL